LLLLNKADLFEGGNLDAESLHQRVSGGPGRVLAVSARTGAGLDKLLAAIDEAVDSDAVSRARFRFPAGEGSGLHLLHEFGRVIETHYTGEYCEVEADVPESLKRRLASHLLNA
jgi:GTP-binding protein HflX